VEVVVADRRRGVDLPARRRDEGDRRIVIRFEGTSGMRTVVLGTVLAVCWSLVADTARAQQVVATSPPSDATDINRSDSRQRTGANHSVLIGHVEIARPDFQLFADQVELFTDQDRAIATGNVVLSQGNSRIAADRGDFNTKTKLGTFYNAWGTATMTPPKNKPTTNPAAGLPPGLPGGAPTTPTAPTTVADTDIYFFGDTVEKLGPRKFKIVNGGFTTCVQPTPRWELTSTVVILNLDHYTAMRNAVFLVKGVPMLYTPFLVYPTNKNARATGILLPTYGASTLRGQSIHNAFFWAIDRSQDATLMYDWFSSAGQGIGTEYRYNYGPGSNGNFSAYLLDQKSSTDPTSVALPASRSYELKGALNQLLPDGFRAKVNVNYFSSFTTMQTFNTNVYDASRNNRTFGGNVVGVVGDFSLNATYNRTEYFYDPTDSAISGSGPHISLSRSERPLFGSPIYFSLTGDYERVLRDNISATTGDQDWSLHRFDFAPQIRYPFKKWTWFTVNTTLSWHDTYYSRSQLDPDTTVNNAIIIQDHGLNRQYFQAQAQLSGPSFTRVWNTPDNGYAEKFKHSIEPVLNVTRTTAIDNYNEIVQNESGDSPVGGATSLSYGVMNRFYAKRRHAGGPGQAREIASVEITQTYYSESLASQHDTTYSTSFLGAPPSNYSPIAVSVRGTPTDTFNTTFRVELDPHYLTARTISANGAYNVNWLTTTVGWNKTAPIPGVVGSLPVGYINATTSAHTKDTRWGTAYSLNFDVINSQLLQQSITGYYNSQCCGIQFQYQVYNFNGLSTGLSVPSDQRFFMSFTLAGLGNFSPFSGALSGAPH
jgi:LPS-assembly protein